MNLEQKTIKAAKIIFSAHQTNETTRKSAAFFRAFLECFVGKPSVAASPL
jgi:hypothetical protein